MNEQKNNLIAGILNSGINITRNLNFRHPTTLTLVVTFRITQFVGKSISKVGLSSTSSASLINIRGRRKRQRVCSIKTKAVHQDPVKF